MIDIPEALIPAPEMLLDGNVRVDDLPKEREKQFELAVDLGFVRTVQNRGPEPPLPKRSSKPARDLRPGDILLRDGRDYKVDRGHGRERLLDLAGR